MSEETTTSIVRALIRMSECTIGTKEAPIMLLCRDGATPQQIAKALKTDISTTKGRIQALMTKRYLKNINLRFGAPAIYKPTQRGLKIVNHILNHKDQ
jgi:DNA-binding NarL/FixJ family response regulator